MLEKDDVIVRKRIFYAFVIAIILVFFIANTYFEMQYDINIFEHFSKSRKLTEEEEKWLENHGKIVYVADQSSPPLRYTDERDGQYRGLVIDYISALSIELKREIAFEPVQSWGEALNSLTNEEKDFFDIIASEDRKKQFGFSDPIYSLSGAIVIDKGNNDIKGYHDLENKKVAIIQGDFAFEFLSKRVENIDYLKTVDMKEALNQLKENNVEAVVGDEPVITYLMDRLNMKDDFRTLDKSIYEKDCVLAVSKTETTLLSILNKGIYNLKKKKVMTDIQQKWFGISKSFTKENNSDRVIILSLSFLSVIGLVIYLSYSWNKSLKREVEKRTEELDSSRNDLQVTFDGLTHLMIVIDKNYVIVNVNEAFCRLVGKDAKDVMGRNCMEFEKILYGHDVESVIAETFEKGMQYQQEFKYKNKIFKISTFPLNDQMKNIPKILIMIKDITQIRISEQQLLQDNKMMAIGELAAGVAHEIRNPLGLIRNYCYVLKTNKNNDQSRREKAIGVIESSVDRASKIIDNLLNFSRLSSNEREKTHMRSFIEDIVALEQKIFEKSNIDYDIVCSKDIVCYAKQESLKHIFVNLITNAIDAMSDEGMIQIKCLMENENLLIDFRDTGCGIDEENLEKIFNPFFTSKIPGKGTGLGLYIVYNEVSKYNGSINVTSELGKGTTFHIILSLKEGEKNEYREEFI